MITHVKARNFKGMKIDQPLEKQNIIIGPNGSGKSSRTKALELALLGYVPEAGKRNQDTWEAFGSGDHLTVAVTAGGYEFERTFWPGKNGSVSQNLRVNQRKVSKDDFVKKLANQGDPRVLDLHAFLALSDKKKIEWIFAVFPPQGNLSKLDNDLEKAKAQLNNTKADLKSTQDSINSLQRQRNELELPAGTLSDIKAKIQEKERELEQAIKDAQQAKADEEAEAKKKNAEKTQASNNQPPPEEDFWTPDPEDFQRPTDWGRQPLTGKGLGDFPHQEQREQASSEAVAKEDAHASIQAIISALDRAGCSACAAKLVAKRELRKYRAEQKEAAHV